jgi:hypothetical protein
MIIEDSPFSAWVPPVWVNNALPSSIAEKENGWRYCFIVKEEGRKAKQWRLKGKFFYGTGCSVTSVENTIVDS